MQPTDDSVLLRQYVGDDSNEAFAALVTRYINLVYSVAFRQVGNPHHAEEITQAVFVILAKKAGTLRYDKALSSWLFQTTRLTANNFLRSEIRRQRREQEAYMQSSLNEPGGEAWPGIAPLLDTAVAGLGEKDRRAVLLRFYEGRNISEVGAALGASEDAAKKRVNRAVEKLRSFFTKRGVVLSAAVLTAAISANSVQAAPAMLAKSVTAIAIAKGAAASGSTLTLIKGALKIMAWTKTKTAIVIGAAALLGVGTTTVIVKMSSPDIQGTWVSTVSLSGSGVHAGESPKARIVLKIARTDGSYQVACENIDKGVKDVPFNNLTYKHGFLHAEIPTDNAIYDATVNFSGTKISGKLIGPKTSLPMVFSRTTSPPSFPEPLADDEFVPRTGSDLQGFWTGVIKIGKNGLHINIKIAEPSDGIFRADIYVPDQGTNRQPTSISYDGTTVKLMPMAGYGMFQGELRNRGTAMAGNWIQGGQKIPTTFTRAN